MPTDQERLTSLEQGVSDLNHNVTILTGVVGSQGADIRVIKEQLATLSQQMQEQFATTNTNIAALNQRLDVSVTAMNQRLETIIALLTGGTQPKPPEQ